MNKIKKILLRLGGPLTFVLIHLVGVVLGAYASTFFANSKSTNKALSTLKNLNNTLNTGATQLTYFMSIIVLFDVGAYVLISSFIADLSKSDMDTTSALFIGALVGVVACVVAHWICRSGTVFWHAESPTKPLGTPLVYTYAFAVCMFSAVPALCAGPHTGLP